MKRRDIAMLMLGAVLWLLITRIESGHADDQQVPYRFTNGEIADADQMNANFDAVVALINENGNRLAALESQNEILQHMSIVYLSDGKEERLKTIRISDVNVQIVAGREGAGPNGLGNFIVGYQRLRGEPFDNQDDRTGTHNVVIGDFHNYNSTSGLVCGVRNTITGNCVAFGEYNEALDQGCCVTGGKLNIARRENASVSGGTMNEARNKCSSVSGGWQCLAAAQYSSVSGGYGNIAGVDIDNGAYASVSGGANVRAEGEYDWAAGDCYFCDQ